MDHTLTTVELIDAVKRLHDVSDYRLASLLDVVPSAIKNYRAGRSTLSNEVALKVCDALGLTKKEDRAYVMACIEHERAVRAGKEDMAALWEILAGKFKATAKKIITHGKAAAVLLAVALMSTFTGGGPDGSVMAAEVHSPDPATISAKSTVHYVKYWHDVLDHA